MAFYLSEMLTALREKASEYKTKPDPTYCAFSKTLLDVATALQQCDNAQKGIANNAVESMRKVISADREVAEIDRLLELYNRDSFDTKNKITLLEELKASLTQENKNGKI